MKSLCYLQMKMWNFRFFFNSILLGVGLAMDAFSVSLANGLNEPKMKKHKMCGVAGVFAGFQAAMPLLGWLCVHSIVQYFSAVQGFIPWIALILLLFIGGKMLIEGIRDNEEETEQSGTLAIGALMIQGIATSIDALSVGFTISDYGFIMAFAFYPLLSLFEKRVFAFLTKRKPREKKPIKIS